jgi:hypothetical protein
MDPSAFNATMGGYSKQQLLEMQKRMQQARSLGSNMAQEYSGFLKGF